MRLFCLSTPSSDPRCSLIPSALLFYAYFRNRLNVCFFIDFSLFSQFKVLFPVNFSIINCRIIINLQKAEKNESSVCFLAYCPYNTLCSCIIQNYIEYYITPRILSSIQRYKKIKSFQSHNLSLIIACSFFSEYPSRLIGAIFRSNQKTLRRYLFCGEFLFSLHFPLGLCGLNFLPGSGPGLVLSI